MLVKAAPGLKVPREDDPRQYITDDTPVELDLAASAYYIRRMADGDLVEATDVPAKATLKAVSTSAAAKD